MVRRSGDLDPLPGNTLQIVYNSYIQFLAVEYRPLFHMQFEVFRREKRRRFRFPLIPNTAQFLTQKRPVDSLRFKSIVDRYAAREKERPHHIRLKTYALLVGERRDDERTKRTHTGISERPGNCQSGKDAVHPVERSRVDHSVNVRSDHQGISAGITFSVKNPEDVPYWVDFHIKSKFLHPLH